MNCFGGEVAFVHCPFQNTARRQKEIDRRLAARANLKNMRTDENQHDYNATLYDLGAALGERYPEDADTPGAFEWYRLGLIAPDEE